MSTVATTSFEHQHDDVVLDGALVVDRGVHSDPKPAVMVLHGIEGRTEAQVDFARRLAEQGYLGVAVDLFGREATLAGQERRTELMGEFLRDRSVLRGRLLHVLDVARAQPGVDPERVAAIGFCFGGLCVLDLARAGADVRGVASFHGLLTPPDLDSEAPITSKVIVFHGWEDPFAPPADVLALGAELTQRDVDWQVHAHGHAMHAFMAETANDPEDGIQHNPDAARRAWSSLESFLTEVLDVP